MAGTLQLALAFMLYNNLLVDRQLIIFTDGGRDIKKLATNVFDGIPHSFVIDWPHLKKKCKEYFSMALQSEYRYKEARAEVSRNFLYRLWIGNLEAAKQYLLHIDHLLIKNGKKAD